MKNKPQIDPAEYAELDPIINNLAAIFFKGTYEAIKHLPDNKKHLATICLIVRLASVVISNICDERAYEDPEELSEDTFAAIRDTIRIVRKKNAERLEAARSDTKLH